MSPVIRISDLGRSYRGGLTLHLACAVSYGVILSEILGRKLSGKKASGGT